jgi:alcohol dehydrogenase (NADP+)
MPETDWPALKSQTMASNGCYIGSSHIGSGKEAAEMLKIAVKHNIKPWIQTMPMKDAAKGIEALEKGTVRYRTVFIQDIDK